MLGDPFDFGQMQNIRARKEVKEAKIPYADGETKEFATKMLKFKMQLG